MIARLSAPNGPYDPVNITTREVAATSENDAANATAQPCDDSCLWHRTLAEPPQSLPGELDTVERLLADVGIWLVLASDPATAHEADPLDYVLPELLEAQARLRRALAQLDRERTRGSHDASETVAAFTPSRNRSSEVS